MAAPLELYCWKGDWGLPSVDADCLTVLVRSTVDINNYGFAVKIRTFEASFVLKFDR